MTEAPPPAPAKVEGKKKEKKGPPEGLVIKPKPKLTKAERRALQEQQRAAKGLSKTGERPDVKGDGGKGKKGDKDGKGKGGQGGDNNQGGSSSNSNSAAGNSKGSSSSSSNAGPSTPERRRDSTGPGSQGVGGSGAPIDMTALRIFSHLPPPANFKPGDLGVTLAGPSKPGIHPSILKLGLKYASGECRGANARARAMLLAFKDVIDDYKTPDGTYLALDLGKKIRPMFQHLTTCRPHSVSMGNAMTFLKTSIATIDKYTPEEEAKADLGTSIERFISEKISFAGEAIAGYACGKIRDRDCILTYGYSEVIEGILTKARREGKQFRVIVCDSRPLMEGRRMLKALQDVNISCTYILQNALSYVMKEVTKVFMGAASILSNGAVLSRVGTYGVALVAEAYSVPVLFCCETYKFSKKVQLDSITFNELGDPAIVASCGNEGLSVKECETLRCLNLLYDLTPADHVSGVISEMGILPPTSVAVLLREME